MPFYELPHTDGKQIWLPRSKRLKPVRERKRRTTRPRPSAPPEVVWPRPEETPAEPESEK